MTAPTVSVVIPTYNGRARLEATVRPLLAEAALHELIVVVDGSEDGSFEWLTEAATRDARLRPVLVPNGGDNQARQHGLERATGDIVLFMDDDVVAGPGLIAGHAAHHAQAPGRVVIGYMPVADPARHSPEDYPHALYAEWYEGQCLEYEARPAQILEGLWNGNVSMRREDALALGIPSPAYDTRYGPDRELGLRMRAHGLEGVFDRSLAAQHAYVRAPHAFFADARSAGEGMWLCHRLHAQRLGPITAAQFERGLSPRTGWLVRAARRPRGARAVDAALAAAVTVTGRTRLWHAQERFAALRARALQLRAALDRD